jgi:alkylhydroperoxidase family enzyme
VALDGSEELSQQVITHPRAITAASSRLQALVEIATMVTREPWKLSRAHLSRAHSAGLSDGDVLQAVALSAYFGHLNRIAHATGVPLDYDVTLAVPATDPGVPALGFAPDTRVGRPAIDLALRPETMRAIADWRNHAFYRDAPLTRRQRTFLARCVARWLGDGGISPPDEITGNPLDGELSTVAEVITLAPWQLGPATFAELRGNGFDDVALFDVVATTSAAGVVSRIEVALVALAV